MILYAGNAGDCFAAQAGLQAFGQLFDALLLFRCCIHEQAVLARTELQELRGFQADFTHRPGQAQAFQAFTQHRHQAGLGLGGGLQAQFQQGIFMVLMAEHNL